MMNLTHPLRRTEELVIQLIGDETLAYDERCHKAFCLNPVASGVWKLCDGFHTVPEIAAAVSLELAEPLTEDGVCFVLAQLGEDGLLLGDSQAGEAAFGLFPSISRRDMVGRLGAGAALLVPVVASIMAPKAAQAYNGCVDCTSRPMRRSPQGNQ